MIKTPQNAPRRRLSLTCTTGNRRNSRTPNVHLMEAAYGYSGSGLFGYPHLMGGDAGGRRPVCSKGSFANARVH